MGSSSQETPPCIEAKKPALGDVAAAQQSATPSETPKGKGKGKGMPKSAPPSKSSATKSFDASAKNLREEKQSLRCYALEGSQRVNGTT